MKTLPKRTPPRRVLHRRLMVHLSSPLMLGISLLLFATGLAAGRISAPTSGSTAGEPYIASTIVPVEPSVSLLDPEPEASSAPQADPAAASNWNLILVNKDHPLPQDYEIPELTHLINGHAIDSRAYPALQRMMDDCRAQGLQPLICSSYRTWEKQEELYERKVQSALASGLTREEAEAQAALWVAPPGTSEHQTALALDIVDKTYQVLDDRQEDTAVQKWLMAHCAEYGYILRYPTDRSAATGIGYEPWHYRYVGPEAAREIMDGGLCLEDYLGR